MIGTSLSEELEKKQVDVCGSYSSMDPLSARDRLRAIKEEFTSVAKDCPYYNEKVRSRCLVDPHVIFMPECTGRSFANGICCPKILQPPADRK
ncbi:MAG: hypothetical protein WED04_01015 [Promethearchaeati archaeon SRVP18_Atabeyarchaeia-1]